MKVLLLRLACLSIMRYWAYFQLSSLIYGKSQLSQLLPGILQEGADIVLLVLFDEPITDFYPAFPFNLNTDEMCALMLKIALTGVGLPLQFSRSSITRDDGEQPV